MLVRELIKFLKTKPQNMECAYDCCSEQVVLEEAQICVEELCVERDDGWIQNKRPDMPTKKYLVFPGN